uniref:Survival motor neuron Tudor domain-containing protein n=1 Tax=Romanomermis culicivorax TaxID=13658 RepID=A0A915JU60_ROMCU
MLEKCSNASANQIVQGLPFAPPPVPPTFLTSNRSKIDENEAMASMLMSWYMSGYHTGYYQALQDSKKPRKH